MSTIATPHHHRHVQSWPRAMADKSYSHIYPNGHRFYAKLQGRTYEIYVFSHPQTKIYYGESVHESYNQSVIRQLRNLIRIFISIRDYVCYGESCKLSKRCKLSKTLYLSKQWRLIKSCRLIERCLISNRCQLSKLCMTGKRCMLSKRCKADVVS